MFKGWQDFESYLVTYMYLCFLFPIISGNGPCLGTRTGPNLEYEWLSYKQASVIYRGQVKSLVDLYMIYMHG